MNFSKLFPKYPIQMYFKERDKTGKKIKIKPTQAYVDFPLKIYFFAISLCSEMLQREVSANEFRRKWKDFVAKEKDTCVDGKPIVRLLLLDNPNSRTVSLRMNWNVFFDYLERKSKEHIAQIEKNGRMIKDAYNEILSNFYTSTGEHERFIMIKKEEFKQQYERNFENFKKILIYTSDYDEIRYLLERILELIGRIENVFYRKNKISAYFTSQIKMSVFGPLSAFEILSIPACYFYLRNILEFLIKLVIYEKIAENFNRDRENALKLLFWGERIKTGGKGIYSLDDLKKWEREVNRALLRIISQPQQEWERKIHVLEDKLFGLTGKSIEIICREYRLQGNLKNLWTACSEVVHNQHPLPFYSLLEVKIFKQFLKYYVEELKKAFFQYVPLTDISTDYCKSEKRLPVQRLKTIYDGLLRNRKEIEKHLSEIIGKEEYQRETWFDPITLSSLFVIWSPSPTRLHWHCLTEDDLNRIIKKVEPLSFQIGLDLRKEFTLQVFYQEIIPKLSDISKEFSNLSEEEKKVVVFWILLTLLPEFLKKS